MKTLGILGGIAPESTIEYYQQVIAAYRERRPDGSYPPLLLNSIDLQKLLSLVAARQLTELTEYLVTELEKLARAGADFGLLASNTPHVVFDEVQRRSPLPLISIVEATCDAAQILGLRRLGLFGTRFTMAGSFYPEVFARKGIALAVPEEADQTYIHDKYLGELVNGVFLPETRENMRSIIEKLKDREGIEGLILGGTELPLLLRQPVESGIPLLDTTRIHVARAVDQMFAP
jgi:aspartate racemase